MADTINDLPPTPFRVIVDGRAGTVKYFGEVDGTAGSWLGVDWDDQRGKHDGTVKDRRYFTAAHEASGSFIRYVPTRVQLGITFLDAVRDRYTTREPVEGAEEANEGTSTSGPDVSIVKWENSNIDVEMVGFAKVAQKQTLENLQEANLTDRLVGNLGDVSIIPSVLPKLAIVDLTGSLFSQWAQIADLACALPCLENLYLNRVRLQLPEDVTTLAGAFDRVRLLTLNLSMHTAEDLAQLVPNFPALEELHFGFNNVAELVPFDAPKLRYLNLQNNALAFDQVAALSDRDRLPMLRHLNLQWNGISSLAPDTVIPHLTTLWISDNNLGQWTDVDALHAWPDLTELRINRNPIYAGDTELARIQVIARLPSLTVLNGSEISEKDRMGAEVYFLKLANEAILAQTGSAIHQDTPIEEVPPLVPAEILAAYPTFLTLASKHGVPAVAPPETEKLKVVTVQLQRLGKNGEAKGAPIQHRILPSANVRHFRALVARQMRISPRKLKLRVTDKWTGRQEYMAADDDMKLVSYYNLEDGQVIDVLDA
ncbi:hypothetical protein AMAG_13369 [Allomyces macrogynus ATCC 38327]|uniref:CAP-Gly domain-containing protein n=1 Tax=Allomyces macrogynus (strain ATCC 38327) TaxID=578462 RepID=A0A0L0T1L1_ALLM3|nr:hypothetical protein AMAG_13369 [Allomyces macrogynus ATCC 38327]|eukprot:KNE68728.1 hypothetical protein AMAG_13369 [Allomyces macrogynus ATCC 38327]